jgi:Zn-dependent M16 (insulinase) family peptidase
MLLIATELMKNVYLHKEIREKGGAYGGGAAYTPTTGNFHFYAYRDPNLNSSVEAFYRAVEVIANKQFNERELEEAKLGVVQTLDAPVPPGNRAMVAYSWAKAGRTLALREAFRSSVIRATSDDVAKAISEHLSGHEGILVSFLGKELYAKEESKLKTPLTLLS